MFHLGVDRFTQPSVPRRKRRRCLEWTSISTWTARGAWSLALMHLSMRMRYKTQLATTLSVVSFGLTAHHWIFDKVASQLSREKLLFAFSLFLCASSLLFPSNPSGFQVIHPNPFTVHRPFSHSSRKFRIRRCCVIVGRVVFFRAISPRLGIQTLDVQGVLYDSLAASNWANQAEY